MWKFNGTEMNNTRMDMQKFNGPEMNNTRMDMQKFNGTEMKKHMQKHGMPPKCADKGM